MVIPEPNDELIRMDGLDVVLAKNRCREIAQVERDDDANSAMNRRRQHMAIIGVGKGQRRAESLVPGDEAIGDVLVHEPPTSGKACGQDIGAISQDVSGPLRVDLFRPASLEQLREGKLHEQVAQRGRVKNAGVVEDD